MAAAFTRTIEVDDEAGTRALAADLAAIVRAGDTVALHGDLGMGKSALARALIRALADDPDLEVPSPTFTLVQTYETPRLPVAHFDLYRLSDPEELREIGFDEAITTGLTLIEWPDRAGEELPANRLDLTIADGAGPDGRVFTLQSADEAWAERIDRTLAIRAMLRAAGMADASRRHLHGDASARSYERAVCGAATAVVMIWPAWRAFMKRADGDRYEDIVHVTDSLDAMAAIGDSLRRRGFRAPRVLGTDRARRLMLIEDLGAEAIVRDGVPVGERYLEAARRLADIAAEPWPAEVAADDGTIWPMPVYDRLALKTEIDLCVDAYVPFAFGRKIEGEARDAWNAIWERLLGRFDGDQSHLVLRDYHSPNILWQADGGDPIGLIDYQDALIGSPAYDLASLITDARVDIPDALADAMLDVYCRRRAVDKTFDAADFAERVVILGAQRNGKILGRFVQYAERTGRTAHLRFLPRVAGNFEKALTHPVLGELKLWYETLRRQGGAAG